jgi:hypothetical protein
MPPTTNAIVVPSEPALVNHSPVNSTQLQPIIAPKESVSTSLRASVLAKLVGVCSEFKLIAFLLLFYLVTHA